MAKISSTQSNINIAQNNYLSPGNQEYGYTYLTSVYDAIYVHKAIKKNDSSDVYKAQRILTALGILDQKFLPSKLGKDYEPSSRFGRIPRRRKRFSFKKKKTRTLHISLISETESTSSLKQEVPPSLVVPIKLFPTSVSVPLLAIATEYLPLLGINVIGKFAELSISPITHYTKQSQKWKGVIIDMQGDVFTAKLEDLDADENATYEIAEFSKDEVSPSDMSLLSIGAVFYWSIGYEMRNGQISKQSIVRFQRVPALTESEIKEVKDWAKSLSDNILWD